MKLVGYLTLEGAKRGERYARIECADPYPHYALITIYGAAGRTGDDELNEDLDPFDGEPVVVSCSLDEHRNIVARVSGICSAIPS